MPRFRIDTALAASLEVKRAGVQAFGVYVLCGMWSAEHGTDGRVPAEVAAEHGTPDAARALVDAELWQHVDGGYLMPLYLDDNPSAEKIAKDRRAGADRQARYSQKPRAPKKRGRVTDASLTRQARVDAPKDASADASVTGMVTDPVPCGGCQCCSLLRCYPGPGADCPDDGACRCTQAAAVPAGGRP
jgi:hypothetical protein